MHHPTYRIAHTTAFVTPVVEHWLEREIAQWVHPMKDRSDDPSHHERTLLPRSCISLLQRDERLRGINMPHTGRSQREVASTFNVSKSVITRVCNWYKQTQNVDDRPHSGCSRATTGVQGLFIRNQALRNRSQTANQIVANLRLATGVRVTGIQPFFMLDDPALPTLTNRHIAHRREWCMERQNWGTRRG